MSQDDQSGTRGLQRNRPDESGLLADRVISVLRDRPVVCSDGVRQFVLDHLVRATLSQDVFNPKQVFEDLRGHRLTVDALIDLYVPNAARSLGQSWVDDEISFAEVTIGSLRLQSLLDEACLRSRFDLETDDTRPNALVILPEGEQHFLGASVVTAQLRRMGLEVSVSFDERLDTLKARVIEEEPGLIMISSSRIEALETIRQTVQTVRAVAGHATTIALGGVILADTDELKELTGVDIVTPNAKDVVAVRMNNAKRWLRS